MEDFWGILFYLAIIVLGGLASAYRNKKKRKMMTPPRPEPQEEPVIDEAPLPGFDPFEELAKRMRFDVEEPKAEAEVVAEPELTVEPELTAEPEPETIIEIPFQSDTVSLETMVKTPEEEGIPAFEETREIMETDLLDKDNVIANSQISDKEIIDEIEQKIDLDLAANIRQGIIYSEILKRKHF
jgi:hypothetical protein